ncbi:Claudin Domain-Containing Protein 1 [Manis pentadactyla]|nr:Claudin Domain-Containing Protein 1 [Manis pentadactyla]
MHMIRLRREFWFNSHVSEETLALMKELGSGSDEGESKMVDQVLEMARMCFRIMGRNDRSRMLTVAVQLNWLKKGDYTIQFQTITMLVIFKVMEEFVEQVHGIHFGMTDVEADGVISETLVLRKELGSGSDEGESKMVDQVLANVRFSSRITVRGRRDIHDDGGVSSGHCSALGLGYVIFKGYGDLDTFRFGILPDVRAKHTLIFIIVVWHGDIIAASEGTG